MRETIRRDKDYFSKVCLCRFKSVSLSSEWFPLPGLGEGRRTPPQREIYALPWGTLGEGRVFSGSFVFQLSSPPHKPYAKGAHFGVTSSNPLYLPATVAVNLPTALPSLQGIMHNGVWSQTTGKVPGSDHYQWCNLRHGQPASWASVSSPGKQRESWCLPPTGSLEALHGKGWDTRPM